MKVVIPQDITAAGKDYLKERGYEIVIGTGNTDIEAMKAQIAGADAILARTAPYTAEVLAAAPNLKVIGRHGIGVDNIDIDYCTAHGIYVCNAPTSNGISVAEHTVGMILACAHHFSLFDRGVRKGEWGFRNKYRSMDLEGKTLGLVGMGRIGSMVAKMCMAAFDMKVIGYDAYLPAERFPAGSTKVETMEDVLKNADFVSLHVPSTPETRGSINKTTIGMMKPTAYLINCARGEVVNEADLYECLKNGVIAGAGIDVFPTEPPAKNCPLFELDNIIMTPHSAALTQESMDRMGLHAAMGIHDALTGKKPQWALNNPVGK
ncbi:MAG: hydroxyacid dehydrogenase [Oscillospiraceae bacterium]